MADDSTSGPFADILAANRRHRDTFSLSGMTGVAAKHLAVLTCVDTRIDPLTVLGLKPGDAKILRNAGARVTDDAIRSLALVVALLGVDRIAVIQHTDCALAKADDETLRRSIAAATGADTSAWEPLAIAGHAGTLRDDLDRIRRSPLIDDRVVLGGFVYDLGTGELRPVT